MNRTLVPYAAPGGAELVAGVAAHAAGNPVLLLANHGPIVAAAGPQSAIDLVEELETAAQLTLLLRQTPAAPLTEASVAKHPGRWSATAP